MPRTSRRRSTRTRFPQEAIAELGLHALQGGDIEELMNRAVDVLREQLDVELAKVLELRPDGSMLLRAGNGWKRGYVGTATVAGGNDSQAGYTLLSAGPVVVADTAAETRFKAPPLLVEHGVVSGMSVIVAGDGRPYGVLGAHTRRHRAFTTNEVGTLQAVANVVAGAIQNQEQAARLRASETKYRSFIEGLPLVTYIDALDEWSSSVYASPQIEALLGYTPGEWSADRELFVRLLHPDDRERVLEEHRRTRKTREPLISEYRMIARDGRVVWLRDQATVVRDEATGEDFLQGFLLDRTEQRRLEERVLQSQRMEAVGQLAGGIAHDFNNLLTAILGYARFILDRLDRDDPLRGDAREIVEAETRATRLIQQLLAFSRRQLRQPEVFDVSDVVADIERMLRRLIGEHIDLTADLAASRCLIRADRSQIEQVIVNLAVNARDAMPDGGRLVLHTACVELDGTDAHAHGATIEPGRYTMLSVQDTGEGMDADTRARIFEPFFTTKPPGKGSGLGLSTVFGIVKQNDGFIWVYSEPGEGTIFRAYFPCAEGEPDQPAEESAGPENGTETILVVEDEEQLRRLIDRELTERGYRVIAAENGEKAHRLVREHRGQIDLLLTDLVMPGISGLELAGELRVSRPQLRILSMTGYAASAMARSVFPGPVIEKPFTLRELARRIRDVLDAT